MTRILLTALLATCLAALPAQAADAGIEKFGLYVVAADLGRAGAYYEQVFQKKPYISTPGIVGFDVAGALYAVVSEAAYAPNVKRGEGTLPYIRVKDIDAEFTRIKAIAPAAMRSEGVVTEGPFRFFKFADPDGNVIEFFSLAATPR